MKGAKRNMDKKALMPMIYRVHKRWGEFMKNTSQSLGMPENCGRIIMFLEKKPGSSQKDISAFTQKTYAAISQTVREMLRSGYITRETDKDDQRYAKLYLTDKGREFANALTEKIHKADCIITKSLTPEKEEEAIKLLTLLYDTIEKEL